MSPDDSHVDPALAAQHVADANERGVAEFAAEARRLGMSRELEEVAWAVFGELQEPFTLLLRATGLDGPDKARVARLAAFMTIRLLELGCDLVDVYGDAAVAANEASLAVLERRERAAGEGGGPLG